MNTTPAAWYIQGENNEPLGPYTSEQLIDSWRAKQLNPSVLCWQEGMASWQPVAAVEPFVSTMRAERKAVRRRTLRLVGIILLIVLVFAATTAVGYFWWTESATLAQAKQLIAAARYDEASMLLEPFASQSSFFPRRANYLLGLGLTKQFASASRADDADDELLVEAKKRFEWLFAMSPRWREEARLDLTGIVGVVPTEASDSLDRSFRLTSFVSTMQLADRKQLAQELFGKAKDVWDNPERGPEQTHDDIVACIVSDDAALTDDIVAAIVSDASDLDASLGRKLACIQHWGRSKPALAPLLMASLVKRADETAAVASLEKRHRLIVAARHIDPQFDAWHFWEKYFRKADIDNPKDAVEILTFMVEDEHNPKHLEDATKLYGDLRRRHPGMQVTPPPEIQDAADAAHLHELIADVDQLLKNRQYHDARMMLDDARSRFTRVWSRDVDAVRFDKEVDFHLHFENAQKSYGNGDFAAALTEVRKALDIHPDDKEAQELRTNVQSAADKVAIEQHRRKAEIATAEGDFHVAVPEILEARKILERPSNADPSRSSSGALDELVKSLINKVREQATELCDKRQYQKAEALIAMVRPVSRKDDGLLELAEKIKILKDDPKSTNISGTWQCNDDGNANQMTLTDTGADSVAWSLSKSKRDHQNTGTFTRKGAALEGKKTVEVRGVTGELTVKLRVETPDTLVRYLSMFTPSSNRQAPEIDRTKHMWTRVKDDTNKMEAGEETDEPIVHSSNRQSTSHDAEEPETPRRPVAPPPRVDRGR